MSSARIAVLIAVSLAANSLADVRVRITATSGAERCLSQLTIAAQPAGSDEVSRVALPDGAASVTIPLKTNERASLRASAPGCWSETVEADASQTEVVLRVFNAVRVRGSFTPDHGRWPAKLEGAAFRPPEGGAQAVSFSDRGHALDCTFDRPNWECVVPANAPFDLRLRPNGFATVYYWDVMARQEMTLDPRQLRSGASISGWVEGPSGKPIEGARVSVVPAAHAPSESAREAARRETGRTDRRGFFQISGLPEGEYRLISRADGFSPAVLPVVNLRASEALVWPRQIVHLPFAELAVTITPPTDPDGKPWSVVAEEVSPLTTPPPAPERHAATIDGAWETRSLRTDMYRVRIEDVHGSVVESFVVDLSASGKTHIPVTVRRNVVRGVVRSSDDPIAASIRFSNRTGRSVRAKTDEDGRFEVSFPAPGKWVPTVFPAGPDGPRITAEEIDVPDTNEDHAIDVILGGGRLRGTVVARDGRKEQAAVHVTQNDRVIAQQITDDDGAFDFIGIEEGKYILSAEGNSGSVRTAETSVAEGETVELTLRLEPYNRVSALVLTPNRAPASGAIVRISTDRGLSWTDLFTNVDGTFQYDLEGNDDHLIVIVLTHGYPASIVQLRASSDATIILQPRGGLLRVRYPSYVAQDDALAPMNMLMVPPSRDGLYDGAAYLEPGVYSVCPERAMTSRCRSVTITAGAEATLETPSSD